MPTVVALEQPATPTSPEQVVTAYATAFHNRDWATAEGYLTGNQYAKIGGVPGGLISEGRGEQLASFRVGPATISGDTATVSSSWTLKNGQTNYDFTLSNKGGWKITNIASTSYAVNTPAPTVPRATATPTAGRTTVKAAYQQAEVAAAIKSWQDDAYLVVASNLSHSVDWWIGAMLDFHPISVENAYNDPNDGKARQWLFVAYSPKAKQLREYVVEAGTALRTTSRSVQGCSRSTSRYSRAHPPSTLAA